MRCHFAFCSAVRTLVKKILISSSVSRSMGPDVLGKASSSFNQAEPSPGLFQLFQANLEFVNEVFARLGSLNFAMMTIRGSPTAEKLPSNMITRSRIRKRINQSNNPRTKFEKSLFEVKGDSFSVGRWTLGVERWTLNLFSAQLRTPARLPLPSRHRSNG